MGRGRKKGNLWRTSKCCCSPPRYDVLILMCNTDWLTRASVCAPSVFVVHRLQDRLSRVFHGASKKGNVAREVHLTAVHDLQAPRAGKVWLGRHST